jgi:cystine transport system permease protein
MGRTVMLNGQELWLLLEEALPVMGKGVIWTLYLSAMAILLGAAIGVCVAVIRMARVPLMHRVCTFYVSCMRGTPLLVQLFVLYYGLPSVGVQLEPLTAGIVGLGLNVGAYLSESLRGALQGVDRGQWLAAQSLGMRRIQILRYVVGPQALRLALPSLSNSLISLVKDTSLVSVIAVTELMLATKEVIATTFQPFPLYLTAAVIYWMISMCLEGIQQLLEKRLARAYSVARI